MKSKLYHVYIMANRRNGTIYTGFTSDIAQRVWQHKNMINPQSFTSRYHCYKLVYFEDYNTPMVAIEREKQLKDKSRKYKIDLIESVNPDWSDLSLNMDFWMS